MGCLPTDEECKHGSLVNAIQNASMRFAKYHPEFPIYRFTEAEEFIRYMEKEGIIIREIRHKPSPSMASALGALQSNNGFKPTGGADGGISNGGVAGSNGISPAA